MTKILLQEFVAEPTCAIGQIPPVADVPNADLAIFIDGDGTRNSTTHSRC